jgi:hypothetical protein
MSRTLGTLYARRHAALFKKVEAVTQHATDQNCVDCGLLWTYIHKSQKEARESTSSTVIINPLLQPTCFNTQTTQRYNKEDSSLGLSPNNRRDTIDYFILHLLPLSLLLLLVWS